MHSYFFDGYVGENETAWALYDVIHNRFILVSKDRDCLLRVSLILSSKVQLYIVNLQQAPNYQANIMDNHCCLNWGFANIASNNLFRLPANQTEIEINPVPLLQPHSEPVSDQHVELQKFAFIAHWAVQHWAARLNWYYRDYFDFIAWPESQRIQKQQERAMYHAIYLGTDYDTVLNQIQAMTP